MKTEQRKKCSKCGIEKDLDEFGKQGSGIRAMCKLCRSIENEVYRLANKEKFRVYNSKWRKANKKKSRAQRSKYKKTHRKEINAQLKQRRKTDIKYKLTGIIRSGILKTLKGNKKGRHWEALVKYTLADLKKHLEKQFVDGMSWENQGKGGWEIDHIIPISAFNFTRPEHRDFKRCWALKNLQPLWEKKNILKSNKLAKPFQPSLLI